MSYRNLTVDGLDYKYVIGKAFVKIVADGKTNLVIPKSEIGIKCFGKYIVKPKMICDYLKYGKIKTVENYFGSCTHTDRERTLNVVPYDAEIEERIIYWYACQECFDDNAMNI